VPSDSDAFIRWLLEFDLPPVPSSPLPSEDATRPSKKRKRIENLPIHEENPLFSEPDDLVGEPSVQPESLVLDNHNSTPTNSPFFLQELLFMLILGQKTLIPIKWKNMLLGSDKWAVGKSITGCVNRILAAVGAYVWDGAGWIKCDEEKHCKPDQVIMGPREITQDMNEIWLTIRSPVCHSCLLVLFLCFETYGPEGIISSRVERIFLGKVPRRKESKRVAATNKRLELEQLQKEIEQNVPEDKRTKKFYLMRPPPANMHLNDLPMPDKSLFVNALVWGLTCGYYYRQGGNNFPLFC